MRQLIHLLFGASRAVSRPFHRAGQLTDKMRLAPIWGGRVLGRSIAPDVHCNAPDLVRLGERAGLESGVNITLAGSLSGGHAKPSVVIGPRSAIGPMTTIRCHGASLVVGTNSHIGPHCHFGAFDKGIKIGDNVLIAPHCSMVDTQHIFEATDRPIIEQGITSKGIAIEDDVWLGASVVIMDGVTIGRGSVIGAGAVVTKNVPPYEVWAGVPAKFLKKRQPKEVV